MSTSATTTPNLSAAFAKNAGDVAKFYVLDVEKVKGAFEGKEGTLNSYADTLQTARKNRIWLSVATAVLAVTPAMPLAVLPAAFLAKKFMDSAKVGKAVRAEVATFEEQRQQKPAAALAAPTVTMG